MVNAHTLPKQTTKKLKRLGQGHGTGRGKTSGRGTKGQNARSNRALSFEGGALPLIKRLPFRRGKGRNNSLQTKPLTVNLNALNILSAKSVVDIDTLIKHNIVVSSEAKKFGVKILGDGELNIALTVKLPVSKSAKEKIEKIGGSVQ
jgi:large subunit ribosomal protein L15